MKANKKISPVMVTVFIEVKGVKNLLLSAFIFFMFGGSNAQPITLQNAIDTALKNNLLAKNQKLNSEYLKRMAGTAYDIPNTIMGTELGQFNSNAFDIKLGISQSIKFPSVYKKQKQLLLEEAKMGQWNEALQKKELTRQVTTIFYEMVYLKEKEKLLQKSDTVYAGFLRKATLRFNKGESNILEKATAENQLGQIKIQWQELQNDFKTLQAQLKYLLNSEIDYLPLADKYKIGFIENKEENFAAAQPAIQLLAQESNINKAQIAVEKAKKTPELMGGLYLQSFRANLSAQNSYMGTYGQLGIALPLFNTAIKNKLWALEIAHQITENKLAIEKQTLQSQYQQLFQLYKKYKETVGYYETEALKNVETVLTAANKKFINGDINYLEWVMLINQNTEVQSSYIEAVRRFNGAIINLNNLTSK